MINTILGTKSVMGQAFTKESKRLPTAMVKSGPNLVTQIKNLEKDGYWAIQLGFGDRNVKHTSKPLQGHFKKIQNSKIKNQKFPRYIKEVKIEKETEYKVGDVINPADVLKIGDLVKVTGISKGKGFAGAVKRHHFAGGPKTHGQSDRHRAPGSIGQGTTPGRVYKGKRMAGRMGTNQATISGLVVLDVDSKEGTIMLSGPIPGVRGNLVLIKKVGEAKRPLEIIQTTKNEGKSYANGQN